MPVCQYPVLQRIFKGYSSALDENPMEVQLFSNSRERRQYDDLADLFSIIKTTEHLEKAYSMDAVSNEEYTKVRSGSENESRLLA